MELSSIYNTAPVGLAVLDRQLRFVRVNERLAAMNGRSVSEHIGRTVGEILPALAHQAEQVLRRILQTGEPLRDVEVRGQTPSMPGVERVWLEQFTPLRDESGEIVAISVVAEEITERRRLEHEVRESQWRLQQALEAARLVMWEWRIDKDEAQFALGDWAKVQKGKQSMGTFRRLVHPDDLAHFDDCIQAHLSGASPIYECEYRIQTAGSGYQWALSKGRITSRSALGEPLLMIGFRQDITAQKEAEADRRQQAQLLELAPDAIFVWNKANGIERWNRGAERIYGYTAQEAVGQVSHELLRTKYPIPLQVLIEHCEQHGTWRGELTRCCKDGRTIRVEAVVQKVDGQPDRLVEIDRDMTAEREAGDRLAANERQLQTYRNRLDVALEAGRMGVWEWLPGSGEAYWSHQIFEFAELPPSPDGKAESAKFLDLVDEEDRSGLDAQLAKALDDGGDYEAEFRIRAPSGHIRWLLSRGRVLHEEGGLGSRLIGINLDITRQKAMEESLRESDVRRNEFLAMLGHELRNPLAPITNAVRLLQRNGVRDEKQAAAVQIIKRQSQHMARLVDDLLEVSRITQGRIELRMENVLVVTAAYAAVETARPLAREKQQKIDVSVPPDLDVVADPARLTQILSNLVVNAVKYTPGGGHIRVAARPAGERFLDIEVSDNGMGISPELLPKIFELFTQDRRTLDRSEGGLGLGLALVRRLVELHGGHVECRSAGQGRGSTFTVCLPRHGRRMELRAKDSHPTAARLAPTSFLVVDDNHDSAETMAALLELDGHRVRLAFDGHQALELASHEAPRIVVLDIGLPGMSGLEVAKRMRAMESLVNAIIIGMSGYAQAEDRAASVAAGFDAHLAKPAEVSDVYRVIEQLRAKK